MNGIKHSTYYAYIWDDLEIYYEFLIYPVKSNLTDEEVEKLIKDLVFFHKEYDKISKKYQILEFFTDEYLDYLGKKSESVYSKLEENLFFNGLVFFPFSSDLGEPYSDHNFISKISIHGEKNSIVKKYIYGMYNTLNDGAGFCDIDYMIKHKGSADKIIDFYREEGYEIGDRFITPMGFRIYLNSNILFPYFEGLYLDGMLHNYDRSTLIDNRKMAYLNAPRFNSYLRDLKDLFVNKCGWNFKFETYTQGEFLKYLTPNGILLGDNVIYQEDIDNGYVNMETYEWIGPDI